MKKILLATLPFYRLLGSHYNGMNLGVNSIAAVLKSRGHDVGVYNADYFDSSKYLSQEELYRNYEDYLNIIHNEKHALWKEIISTITSWDPDYLGISMLTANYPVAKIICKKLKMLKPSLKIIVGGVHATLAYKHLIKEKHFDYIVRGEGEFVFLELINNVPLKDIQGLSYRDKTGAVFHNQDRAPIDPLDILPFPARDLYITSTHMMDLGQIVTSRGCPFGCTYCASPLLWKRRVRYRSIYDVVTELELINKHYQSSMIYISDDTFTLQKDRTLTLCNEIIDRGMRMTWKCDTRVDCLDEELVGKMREAGCELIKIGVETGSERIMKEIQKGITKEKIRQAVKFVRASGIKLTVYLMAGFPGETDDDVRETIDFAHELDADYYSLSILTPYYGTDVYQYLSRPEFRSAKEHWEYFYHQGRKLLVNNKISDDMLSSFLEINQNRTRI